MRAIIVPDIKVAVSRIIATKTKNCTDLLSSFLAAVGDIDDPDTKRRKKDYARLVVAAYLTFDDVREYGSIDKIANDISIDQVMTARLLQDALARKSNSSEEIRNFVSNIKKIERLANEGQKDAIEQVRILDKLISSSDQDGFVVSPDPGTLAFVESRQSDVTPERVLMALASSGIAFELPCIEPAELPRFISAACEVRERHRNARDDFVGELWSYVGTCKKAIDTGDAKSVQSFFEWNVLPELRHKMISYQRSIIKDKNAGKWGIIQGAPALVAKLAAGDVLGAKLSAVEMLVGLLRGSVTAGQESPARPLCEYMINIRELSSVVRGSRNNA